MRCIYCSAVLIVCDASRYKLELEEYRVMEKRKEGLDFDWAFLSATRRVLDSPLSRSVPFVGSVEVVRNVKYVVHS